jgi:hypothetical protein
MLNEVQEFKDYTTFPAYESKRVSDTAFLGRFTLEAIRDFHGFDRVFTILARHFLFQDGDPYEKVSRARRALCAWVSIPDDGDDLKGWEGKFTTCFPELHEEFPNLVDAQGNGWYIRHIRSVAAYAQQNPKLVKANIRNFFQENLAEYEKRWRIKVRQFQIPIFLENTDAMWQIRFDDVIANALTLGPLREMEAKVTEQQKEKLLPFVQGEVKLKYLTTLVAYYLANKPEDSDWVVLPSINFNCYFGSTVFSKKVLREITGKVIQRSDTSYGSGRYRVLEEFL